MPWRGPDYPGEFPTLGYLAADWIEANCVVPDGDLAGQPFRLIDDQLRYLLWHYRLRLDADGDFPARAWSYRRSMLVRPQKYGKGPISAAVLAFEGVGPAQFAGWDASGEPIGRPWATPWIQVAAASEDQTANVWRALMPMIQEGPLADVIPDVGLDRINLRGGGRIEPVTAEGRSRLGQRLTFALHDEPHSWLKGNGGWRLADTQRRNLAGMGGRSMATTNAWNPSEQSDAQRTFEARLPDVYVDYPVPPAGSVRNKRDRRKVLRAVYAGAHWVDLDRIDAEIEELLAKGDPAQAERFFLNRIVADVDAWLEHPQDWDGLAEPLEVPVGTRITLGFDGSDVSDRTALRARVVDSGYGFTPTYGDDRPCSWDPADFGGYTPREEVNEAVAWVFNRYDVVRMYCDPPLWQTEVDTWAGRWPGRVFRWETYRPRQMSAALDRLRTDISARTFRHDGCPHTARAIANARKRVRSGMVLVGKDRPDSPNKIDELICDALAHEARADVLADGTKTRQRSGRVAGF